MGFFKNIGVSYEYLYDLMSFDHAYTRDIGSYESDPGEIVERAIVKEKSGFCIRIRRERQKRARTLRFSYIDIIRLIENETPKLKDEKILGIRFIGSYIYNTIGYRGKSTIIYIDFGDPTYQYTYQYFLGHEIA